MKETTNRIIYLIGFFTLMVFSSCNIEEDIIVGEPEYFAFGGIKNNQVKITTSIPVLNNKPFNLKITEVDIAARVDNRYLGKITLDEEVIIEKKSEGVKDITLNLKIQNLLLGASTFYKFTQNNNDLNFSLDGDVYVKYLLVRKKIKVDEKNIQDRIKP